jgi:hypothetical protein
MVKPMLQQHRVSEPHPVSLPTFPTTPRWLKEDNQRSAGVVEACMRV